MITYETTPEEKKAAAIKEGLLPTANKLSITYLVAGKAVTKVYDADSAIMDTTTNTFKVRNKAGLVLAEFERDIFIVCEAIGVK